jgi:hypothetical protein
MGRLTNGGESGAGRVVAAAGQWGELTASKPADARQRQENAALIGAADAFASLV